MRISKRTGGFSFIDLLVILALLAVAVVGGRALLGDFGAETADARRVSDMNDLKGALEKYHESCGSYPLNLSDVSTPASGNKSCSVNLLSFINPIPRDPLTDQPYSYDVSHTNSPGQYYCLGADFDDNDHPKKNIEDASLPIEISCDGDYIIMVKNG